MATLILMTLLSASGNEYIVAPLVPGAQALEEEGRYESPRNFDDTIDYYKRVFKNVGGVRWRHIVNLPGIKAKHLKSIRKKTKWEGINIYETGGKVRFFIIPRPQTPPKSKK